MNTAVSSYAMVLLTLPLEAETVSIAEKCFAICPKLMDVLQNPTIPEGEKFAVIRRLFPKVLQDFLCVVCRNGRIGCILDIFTEYAALKRQQENCAHAVLEYVTPLTQEQTEAMKRMVCTKTGKPEVFLEQRQNPALLGGFVLHIGDDTYDRSVRACAKALRKNLIRR